MTFLQREKPKRCLTAYNLFFQEERKRLLETLPVRLDVKSKKAHGKIGFTELARKISYEWKHITPDRKSYYAELANKDKIRYMQEMEEWQTFITSQEVKEQEEPDDLSKAASNHRSTTNDSTVDDMIRPLPLTVIPSFSPTNENVSFAGTTESLGLARNSTTEQLIEQLEPAIFQHGRPTPMQARPNKGGNSSMLTDEVALARLAQHLDAECQEIFITAFPCRTPYYY